MLGVMVQVLEVCELLHRLAAVLPLAPEFQRLDEGLVSLADLVEQAEAAFGTVSQHDVHQALVAEVGHAFGALMSGQPHNILAHVADARLRHQLVHGPSFGHAILSYVSDHWFFAKVE